MVKIRVKNHQPNTTTSKHYWDHLHDACNADSLATGNVYFTCSW